MSLREPPSPHSAATADLATPPGDWDETLLRAIEAGRVSALRDDDPQLAQAVAAYQKIAHHPTKADVAGNGGGIAKHCWPGPALQGESHKMAGSTGPMRR